MSSGVPNLDPSATINNAFQTVARYQGASAGVQAVGGMASNMVGAVAVQALAQAPAPVRGCASVGAAIGFWCGGGPITAAMGAGSGAVVGLIWSAAKGLFG